MSQQREQPEDWRAKLGREFNRPMSDEQPRREPPRPASGGPRGEARPATGPPADAARRGDARPPGGEGGLPPGYLRGGYFDTDGYLRPELIVEQARGIAENLARAGLATAALRRFFGMARRAESLLQSDGSFAAARVALLELKPFAANARTREVIPTLFHEFIDRNVEQAVAGEREFLKGFLPHFQYVVAYFPKAR